MASYLEKYQYDKVTPFSTDYEGMLRTLGTKEAYWKIGVQRVKTAYEQAAGLSLTGKTAKDSLESFMKRADGELMKTMATDVSLSGNAQNGIEIYKPLYKNNEIMSNHKTTDFYQNEFNTINSFRTKNNGKEYSDVNARDVMNSYADFAKGIEEGRSATEFENTKRSYTPYVDVTEQSLDILKKCPKDSTSIMGTGEDPLTFKTVEDNSLTASKLAGCLNAALDSKYKNQLLVDQRVNFHNNPQALGQNWLSLANEDITDLTEEYKRAKANASFSIKEPEKNKYFNDVANDLNKQIEEKQKAVGKIVKGDYSDVQNNFDQYAYQVGVYGHVQRFASSFNSINTKTEYTPNIGALQKDKQHFEREQSYINQNFEMSKQDSKFKQDQILSEQDSDEALKLEYFKQTGKTLDTKGLTDLKENGGISAWSDPTVSKIQDKQEIIENGVVYLKDIKQEETNNNTALTQAATDLKNSEALKNDKDALTILAVVGIDFKDNSYVTEDNINNLKNIIDTYNKNPSNSSLDGASINELNKYLKRVKPLLEDNKYIQKENSFLRIEVDKEMQGFKTKFGAEKLELTLNNNQKINISKQEAFDLERLGKSGAFKKEIIKKDYLPEERFRFKGQPIPQKTITQYTYNGIPINLPQSTNLTKVANGKGFKVSTFINDFVKADVEKYKQKELDVQNRVYGQAFANSKVYYSERMLNDEKLAKKMEEATKTKLNLNNLNKDNKDASEYTVKGYGADNDIYVNVSETLYENNKGKNNITGYKDEQGYMLIIPVAKGVVPENPTPLEIKNNKRILSLQKAFVDYAPADNSRHTLIETESNKGTKVRIVGTKTSSGPSYAIEIFDSNKDKYIQSTKNPAMYDNPDFTDISTQLINYRNNY